MNHIDHLERELTAWFVDTAIPRMPDYTDDILRRTARTRQRPRWTFPERWLPPSMITLGRRTFKPLPWRTIGLLALLAVLLAAALAIYMGSRPRLPTPFGLAGNGLIAYGANNDIVTVDPITGATATIVGGPSIDGFPAWSRDGTRIAFARSIDGWTELLSVTSDGGQPIELTRRPVEAARGLMWSPDGSALAFSDGDLWIIESDGNGRRPLDIDVQGGVEFPQWRPPTGLEIQFESEAGLFLVRPDGSGLRPITFVDGAIVRDESVSWTPDGNRIVTTRRTIGQDGEVAFRIHSMMLGVDGRIVDDMVVGPPVLPTVGSNLSPDGTRVLFALAQAPGTVEWRIAVIPVDGSGPVVTTGPTFTGSERIGAWSPDGTVIVVNDLQQEETWLLDANGGPGRRADWADPSEEPPAWQRLAP